MATQSYLQGRRTYTRPHAMMWSEQAPTIVNGQYVPYGLEVNDSVPALTDAELQNQFLILTDDNRKPLQFKPQRIETRKRMINGQMRSYHTADKFTISTSWDLVPSRGFATYPQFNATTGKTSLTDPSLQYTSDGGAGGVDMLDWYQNHTGSFWVYLSYDKYNEFAKDQFRFQRLGEYPQAIEMFISSFDYDVVKRGGSTYDLWNVSVTLEEV